MMETGDHFESNTRKLKNVTERDWAVAFDKCREHCKLRVEHRKLFGAHSRSKLVDEAEDYYTKQACELLISGGWEWKDEYSLGDQMIRIVGSKISAEVEKTKTKKAETLKHVTISLEETFYQPISSTSEELKEMEELLSSQVECLELTVQGDTDLAYYWECIKEKMKRKEIAEVMDKTVRQIDKVREKFVDLVRKKCLSY